MFEDLNTELKPALSVTPSPTAAPDISSDALDNNRQLDLEVCAPAPEEEQEQEPAGLAEWKDALRNEFEQWLATVKEIPHAEPDGMEESEAPDLYSFYEQLAVLNAESRKANRRTAEAFSQWGETLVRFEADLSQLREHLIRLASVATKEDSVPRAFCLALVEILDRMYRLAAAFGSPPKKSWWEDDTQMRRAWETQRQALDILVGHMEALLEKEGVARIEVLGQAFDPAIMVAVATEPDLKRPARTVIEEITTGYRRHGELLRPAQVKITINQSNS
jgi:molecular chaperone GrpE (heat shock protein)